MLEYSWLDYSFIPRIILASCWGIAWADKFIDVPFRFLWRTTWNWMALVDLVKTLFWVDDFRWFYDNWPKLIRTHIFEDWIITCACTLHIALQFPVISEKFIQRFEWCSKSGQNYFFLVHLDHELGYFPEVFEEFGICLRLFINQLFILL